MNDAIRRAIAELQPTRRRTAGYGGVIVKPEMSDAQLGIRQQHARVFTKLGEGKARWVQEGRRCEAPPVCPGPDALLCRTHPWEFICEVWEGDISDPMTSLAGGPTMGDNRIAGRTYGYAYVRGALYKNPFK